MHMADALISPAVGGTMWALSTGAVAYSAMKMKGNLDEKKIPVMGVTGALVFAGQMINFTIPGTGSSGHIGGGLLLAALLGPFPAFLVMTAVLMIQCLFFADGGLLALGCNIFNMAFYSCFLAYPLIFKPMTKKGLNPKNITIASIVTAVIGLQLGAFSVVMETLLSGVTKLPFSAFVALMQPIHLAIGIGEGIITATVLIFVYKTRPEIMESTIEGQRMNNVSLKKVMTILVIFTIVVAGGLSLFASSNPDGLEWAMEKVAGTAELEYNSGAHEAAKSIQEKTAFMPDYSLKGSKETVAMGTSVAGITGGAITLVLAGLTGVTISSLKKKKKKSKIS